MTAIATRRTPTVYSRFITQLLSAWRAGMLCRCSVVVGIIVCIALQTSQAVEALLVVGENGSAWLRQFVLLGISAVGFSLTCWYCPRVLQYRLAPGYLAGQKQLATFVSRLLPRLCAVLPLLALSMGFISAAASRNGVQSDANGTLYYAAIGTGIAAMLMYLLLTFRIPWIARRRPELLEQWMKARGEIDESTDEDADEPIAPEGATVATPTPTAKEPIAEGYRLTPLRLLPWGTYVASGLIAVPAAGFLALFIVQPQSAIWFGPITILYASAAIWVAFGTVLAYVGTRVRLPLFLAMLALAALFSGFDWNDNHEVRHTVATPSAPKSWRDSIVTPVYARERALNQVFQDWLDSRPDSKDKYEALGFYPVVIVCCEGGGLFAAYHTATQLAALQDADPTFASHIFAISSVSGGSLGAAVFVSAVHRYGTSKPPQGSMKAAVADVLNDDFLSPLLASGLYPDMLQRFWFAPIPSFDRARALEHGFERAWTNKIGGHEFDAPFDALQSDPAHPGPYLILNTTNVEGGGRTVVTQLPLNGPYFSTINSISTMHPGASLPLSTAVVLGSRFPYITPAGYLMTPRKEKLRYVDGGYFEDTGAATTLDLLYALREYRNLKRAAITFIVVRIGVAEDPRQDNKTLLHSLKYSWQGFGESLSPVRTLLNTRTARGTAALQALRMNVGFNAPRTFPTDLYFDFPLVQRRVPMPLGWLMSSRTRAEIDDQVKYGHRFYTKRVLEEISGKRPAPRMPGH